MRKVRRAAVSARAGDARRIAGLPSALLRLFHLRPAAAEGRPVRRARRPAAVPRRPREGSLPHPVDQQRSALCYTHYVTLVLVALGLIQLGWAVFVFVTVTVTASLPSSLLACPVPLLFHYV